MSEPSASATEPYQPPPIEKLLPRPAPTLAYSYVEYNPDISLVYVRDHDQANAVLHVPPTGPLGFDLEWRPTYVKGAPVNRVALVQLASQTSVMLFQISAMKGFPSRLVDLLADPTIVKAGVAIQGDAQKLFDDYNVSVRNCVDLSLLARTVDNERWAGKYASPIGLARLVQSYEYRLLPKDKVTRSNWEALLNTKQLEYARNDAHAGYILYKRLEAMIPAMPSPPNSTWYSFSIFHGNLCDPTGAPWVPTNPNYDPGPLPPPREPTAAQLARKEKRLKLLEERAHQPSSHSSTIANPGRPQTAAVPPQQDVRQSGLQQRRPFVVPSTRQSVLPQGYGNPSNAGRNYLSHGYHGQRTSDGRDNLLSHQQQSNSSSSGDRGYLSHVTRHNNDPRTLGGRNSLSHQQRSNGFHRPGRGSGPKYAARTSTTPRNNQANAQPVPPFPNRSTRAKVPPSSTSTVPSSS